MTDQDRSFGAVMQDLDDLLQVAERELPGAALERTRHIVGTLLELHRQGLCGIVESLHRSAEGERALREAARQEAIAVILAMHGLHPDPFEVRVRGAVSKADTEAGKEGSVEVARIEGNQVVVRVRGRASAACDRLAALAEAAVMARAPEADLQLESELPQQSDIVPLSRLSTRARAAR